tara:strand:+ start:6227 stop:6379 length:153 start_codon:yes stop_codon:yes gene_type:complete
MVLNENQGQVLTEAMRVGLENVIVHYCSNISRAAEKAAGEVESAIEKKEE